MADGSFPDVLPVPGSQARAQNASCPGCEQVHRVLAELAAETAGHDSHARRLRAAGDRRRVREAERHEAMAQVLRDTRVRLARALQQWG